MLVNSDGAINLISHSAVLILDKERVAGGAKNFLFHGESLRKLKGHITWNLRQTDGINGDISYVSLYWLAVMRLLILLLHGRGSGRCVSRLLGIRRLLGVRALLRVRCLLGIGLVKRGLLAHVRRLGGIGRLVEGSCVRLRGGILKGRLLLRIAVLRETRVTGGETCDGGGERRRRRAVRRLIIRHSRLNEGVTQVGRRWGEALVGHVLVGYVLVGYVLVGLGCSVLKDGLRRWRTGIRYSCMQAARLCCTEAE